MPDDKLQMPPMWKQFPGLYQSQPQPKLNAEKQIAQERVAGEFLSPQEQILRHAMQVGNFQYGDLNKLDIPQAPDLKALLNSINSSLADRARANVPQMVPNSNNAQPVIPSTTGVISPPPIDAPKVDAQASPQPIGTSDDADLDSDLRTLKTLRGK